MVKSLPAVRETKVRSLGEEVPLKLEMIFKVEIAAIEGVILSS